MPVKSLSAAAVLSAMILLLFIGDSASDAVLSSMELCVTRVIPSLFPYMVLSSLMISMDLTEPLYRRLPTEKWLGLPRCAASVLFTGLFCGFPVGAAGCAALVRDGKLNRDDAAALCAASSASSPAFVIGTVGQWWGREYGTLLWMTQVICALFTGAFVFRGSGQSPVHETASQTNTGGFPGHLASAVSSAASSCIAVIASVTFFGSTARILSHLIPWLTVPASVLLEFSQGSAAGAKMGGMPGIIVTGAAVGFTGISVMIQSAASLAPEKISLKPLILSKIAAMAVSAAVSAVYYLLRRPVSHRIPASASVFTPGDGYTALLLLGLVYLTFRLLAGSLKSRIKHTEKV